ncbi:MAG: trehalose-6-phosphate synthase, partial [bacterium]
MVSGLETFLMKSNIDYKWVGWPGTSLNKRQTQELEGIIREENLPYIPVYVPERLMDKFYNGFCNKTLWPLMHNLAPLAVFSQDYWQSYVEVNRLFLNALLSSWGEVGDKETYVWVHDYHLMLLPGMLRDALQDVNVGFFLHIPFPPPETFAQLPWRRETLEGLLGAD